MQTSSEVTAAPIQYEALQQTNDTLRDIQTVGDVTVRQMAFQLDRTEATAESNMNSESRLAYQSFQDLRNLPQLKNNYKEPIHITNDAKGMLAQGNDLFIQIDDSNPDARTVRPAIKPEQTDENTPLPARILTINGSNNNNFTCVVETGAGEKRVITLPRQTVEQAQILSQQTEILAGITDENVRKVVQAHIDSIKGIVGPTHIDQQTLVEAAKASAQVTTESLNQFVDKAAPEKPDDPEFTEKRNAIKEKLSNHTVATQEDFVDVLTFIGPEMVTSMKTQLQAEIAEKRDLLKNLNTPESAQERTRIQQELNDLQQNLEDLADAEKMYSDPASFELFVDVMTSGKLTKEQAMLIGQHFEDGEMVKAMQEIAKAKIEAMPPDEQERFNQFMSKEKQELLLKAGGGAALVLFLLFFSAIQEAGTG